MNAPPTPPAELWLPLVSGHERDHLAAAGFGQRRGLGDRHALLIIDAQNYMAGPLTPEDRTNYPSSCGDQARSALPRIAELAACMRRRAGPVICTRFELAGDGSDAGIYQLKRPLLREPGWCLPGGQLADPVRPVTGDLILVKTTPVRRRRPHR